MLAAATRRGLVRANPVPLVERPREPRRRWRILSPAELGAVERAFDELILEAKDEERTWREQARVIFLVLVGAGLRRGEVLGLRWRSVHLADPEGAFLRIEETFVRAGTDTPKSAAGERTVALGNRLASELFAHRAKTSFAGDDEYLFCSLTKGTPFDVARYPRRSGSRLPGGRHRSGAAVSRHAPHKHHERGCGGHAAGSADGSRGALGFQDDAGHIDLAGETFRDEAERLERRLWGGRTRKSFPQSGTTTVPKWGASGRITQPHSVPLIDA